MAICGSIDLTIALPAYREAESLRVLLPALCAVARNLSASCEILVIDADVPLDDTGEVCARNGVVHVHRTGGSRYGDAVRTAIARARGTWVVFMDADGSHPPSIVAELWERRNTADVLIGSRYVSGGGTDNPSLLVGMSWLLNTTFRIAFGLTCLDVTNSLRLYRGDLLRRLTLRSDDFDILQEVLIKLSAQRPPPSIVEIPMRFERRSAGESKRRLVPFMISYLRTMARLWRLRGVA